MSVSSVAQSCPTLCDPMDCGRPGFPVHHKLPELLKFMFIESMVPSNLSSSVDPFLASRGVPLRVYGTRTKLEPWRRVLDYIGKRVSHNDLGASGLKRILKPKASGTQEGK